MSFNLTRALILFLSLLLASRLFSIRDFLSGGRPRPRFLFSASLLSFVGLSWVSTWLPSLASSSTLSTKLCRKSGSEGSEQGKGRGSISNSCGSNRGNGRNTEISSKNTVPSSKSKCFSFHWRNLTNNKSPTYPPFGRPVIMLISW